MTIVLPFIVIVSVLGIMMGSGGSAVVGQLLGAGDRKGANRAFSLIAWATFVTGVVCSVLGMAFMDEAVVLLGASARWRLWLQRMARLYSCACRCSCSPMCSRCSAPWRANPASGSCRRLPRAWSTSAWMPCSWACSAWGSRAPPRQPASPSTRRQCSWSSCSHGARFGVLKLVRPRWVQGVLPRSIVNGVSEMVGCAAMSVVATAYNLQLMNLFGPDGVAAYAVIEYASMLIGAAFGGLTEGMASVDKLSARCGKQPREAQLVRQRCHAYGGDGHWGVLGRSAFSAAVGICVHGL